MNKYRVESGSVYEYDSDQNGYVFIGNLNGQDFDTWIIEYENDCQNYGDWVEYYDQCVLGI